MRKKFAALVGLVILAGIFLPHLACKSNSLVPISPGGQGYSLKFTAVVSNEVKAKLLGSSANQILYRITGPSISPVSGSTTPFGTAGDSGEVSFAISAPQGEGELLAFEITSALDNEPLAVGAVQADVEPGVSDLSVTMGTLVSPCHTVDTSSFGGNAYINFQQDVVDAGAPTGVAADLKISAVPSGSVTHYTFTPQNGNVMKFMGNKDIVNYAAIPGTFPLSGASANLAAGDVYCLQIPSTVTGPGPVHDYVWIHVINPNQSFGPNAPVTQGPLFSFRVSNLPYFGYYQTTADLASNCYAPPATPTPVGISGTGNVTDFAGSGQRGASNGTTLSSSFNYPSGLAVDGAGDFFIADTANNRIREISSTGVVSTLAGTGVIGHQDGPGAQASFSLPYGIAVNTAGTQVFVADTCNSEIRVIDVATGAVTTLAGAVSQTGHVDSTNYFTARFNHPVGLAFDSAATVLYVADSGNNLIRTVSPAGVTTIAGTTQGSQDGSALSAAQFYAPVGVALDGAGNVYVADGLNREIRVINGGNVSTLAGTAGVSGLSNGSLGQGNSTFALPVQLAADGSGDVYVVDTANNVVREITTGGVSTLAGTGAVGSANGRSAYATFNYPEGLALFGGNVYVTDTNNLKIRKITP
jgi:DNA-binding beta-propeller fold protein YncE